MLLHYIVPYGLSLFAFDFSGSGMSDGEYISLGVNEKHDVETVVDYLIATCCVTSIVLWGHSMGAATALMYAGLCKRRPEVKALVLDSPFASFDKLAQSMVAEMPIPMAVPRKLILTVGVRAVRKVVRERADFDVVDIDPFSAQRKIDYELPALFLHGTADAVVPLQHGQLLHKNYPCKKKELIVMQGFEHDTPRPEWVMDRAHVFLQTHLMEGGARGMQYLEHLKARGNSAMLSGRFDDSIYLYTEALNALSMSVTKHCFAAAVGELPRLDKLNDGDSDDREDRLARNNSSISNLVSTVKRWRYPRTTIAAEEGLNAKVLSTAAKVSKTSHESNGLASKRRASHTDPLLANSEGIAPSRISDPTAGSTPDHDLNVTDVAGLHSSRSENLARNGRFSRNGGLHAWRARGLMDNIKTKMRIQKLRADSTATPNAEIGEMEALTTSGVTPEASQDNIPPNTFPDAHATPTEEGKDGAGANRRSQKGLSWRSSGTGRISRSSSKAQMRLRGKQRQNRRKIRQVDSAENKGRKGAGQSKEEGRWRIAPDLVSIRNRFLDDPIARQDKLEDANRLDEEQVLPKSISSWNLDQERKAITLALLGNRSLARRNAKNVEGALFDARLCLELDAGWMRGYVRKAAALRQDGLLEEARECVLEGLRQDEEHAGLADMLQSINLAMEADQLAKRRNATHTNAKTDGVSAQA